MYAARYSNTGLPYFYEMKLSKLWKVIRDVSEAIQEENRRIKGMKTNGR